MCLACDNDCCALDQADSCDCDDCHNAYCWSAEVYADKYGDAEIPPPAAARLSAPFAKGGGEGGAERGILGGAA